MTTMRGGARFKSEHKNGFSALLDAIWQRYGGPANISRLTGVSPQNLVNWRFRGRVPILQVTRVAKALNIPTYGLNYRELCSLEDHPPTWKEVVAMYDLDAQVVRHVLSFKEK